jgi:DegV family protein with EDD domain
MKIVTDCAADMPLAELQALDITQAPLFIQFPEGQVNSADLTIDQFYDRLEAMRPVIPTTSQPSGGEFAEIYRGVLPADRQILSLHISSGLSGTANAARIGGEQIAGEGRVTVWDTLTLSGGERFQVIAAALAARAGWALEDIERRLQEIRAHTEVLYTLDTLEYLARGGRIGRVQALTGSLLHIKPVITVDHKDGKYTNVTKSRSLPRALVAIADHLQTVYAGSAVWVTVLHGRLAGEAATLAQELSKKLNVGRLETMRISPVLGVHTGPAVVGAAAVPLQLLAGLPLPRL